MPKIALSLLCVFAALSLRAEEPLNPEQTASAYFDAFRAKDAAKMAEMMNPKDLEHFKTGIIDLAPDYKRAGLQMEKAFFGQFEGIESIDGLKSLDPKALYQLFLQTTIKQAPGSFEIKAKLQFLGHVKELDTLAHVVIRYNFQSDKGDTSQIKVITLIRDSEKRWRVSLAEDLETIIATYRKSVRPE